MSNLHRLYGTFGGYCCYCGCKTWIPGKRKREQVLRRFGIEPNSHGSAKALGYRRATREHLKRVAEGGGSEMANLVLSCAWCNVARGEAAPDQHRENIARAIAAGLHPNHPPLADLSGAAMRRARKAVGLSQFACVAATAIEPAHAG